MIAYDAIVNRHRRGRSIPARRLATGRMSVTVIERRLVGGTCVNTGSMPTKTLVASAEAAHIALRAADFGASIAGPVAIDMKRVKARRDAAVNVSGVLTHGGCNRNGARMHTAYDDFEIAAANLLDDDPRRVSHRIPTYATACTPRRPMP